MDLIISIPSCLYQSHIPELEIPALKALGMFVGFKKKGADVRIAQYESKYKRPKEKLVNGLAEALGVSPDAIRACSIQSDIPYATLYPIIKGQVDIGTCSYFTVAKLARFLGYRPDEIVYEKEDFQTFRNNLHHRIKRNELACIRDVITRFADENNLPRDWMNTGFVKTASYSDVLAEVSRHYYWLNNKTLEIRTVSGIYLIAMKMIAHRDYRNDISDAIGILTEEAEAGNHYSYDEIEAACQKLYHEAPDPKTREQFRELCAKSVEELRNLYNSRKDSESFVGSQLISYIEDGFKPDTKNVTDVAARIRERMNQNQ